MNRRSSIHKPMLLVSSGIFTTRIFGLLRDVVLAQVWGTGAAMGAFVFAFTIPNLLRSLFGEGAFSAAFVPVFSEKLEKEGREQAWESASKIVSLLSVVLVATVLLVLLLSFFVGDFFTFDNRDLTLRLLRRLMPYAILICLSVALGSALNALGRFALPAFSPLLLNVGILVAALLSPLVGQTPEERIFALVYGILGAGVLQLALHFLRCRQLGYRFRFNPDIKAPETRRVIHLITPVLIGAGVVQLNTLVDRSLASYLGPAAISSLYYSQRIIYLPVGLFGAALSIVVLPSLSRSWAREDVDEMKSSLEYGLRQILFLTLPFVACFWLLRYDLVEVLFQRGTFDEQSLRETVWPLVFYLPGIPAFAGARIAVTPFHAAQDTRTPLRIALICVVLNIILNVTLIQFLDQGGLALATTICSWINLFLLLYYLRKKTGPLNYLSLIWACARFAGISLVALGSGYLVRHLLGEPEATAWIPEFAMQLGHVLLVIGVGAGVYLLICTLFKFSELEDTWKVLREHL